MGAYDPLGQFLGHLKGDYWRPTFHELERLLGRELPATARKRESWWTAVGSGHTKTWLDTGWAASDVNFDKETVTFRRQGTSPEPAPEEAAPPARLRERALRIAREKPLLTVSATAAGAFVAGLALGLVIGDET